ncbi:helix-turn-helix transcriptional regulator [Euzebya sp.]|uniref:helix-turn-helix transcriptional regulator n=1 Tax=Euzebya sp. TaxID=1971409 RepID=UPI003513B1DA
MNRTLARLRRILVMVPWLLEHPGISVEEVADRFDVTAGDVLDDLDVLGYCGLPGYGGGDLIEASVNGGQVVVRMAEFFSRPLALSVREGLSLLLAARATRESGVLGDDVNDGPLSTAIAKLETHLGAEAGVPVAMDVSAGGADHLSRLWPAVQERRVVRLTYRSASKDETTVREVEPWTLRSLGGAWYLQGWCRLATDHRSFRLDRIVNAEVTDEPAPPPPEEEVRPPVYRPGPDDPVVVVDVSPDAVWISDHVVLSDRQPAAAGWTRLVFQAATLDWAARLVVRLGGQARVVEPPALQELVHRRARGVLARYGDVD